ncbi:flagellin [Ensifer sp. PDNC004]|uniref:flagellin N-terminal helical domain-containing protein n=1 Tax=unclassified Ensifer TaxID=2633371 RepID=UPI00177C4DAA|nr:MULTISPECIES: flagellin [unclassified Ensifer]MBD9649095.1 flagellin [Ensifer sp. ENS09]QRY66489.1 flagellin [Ensifer sp. PDNC004]
MTSIITNSSAMGALATLRSINSSMETTQERISSGLRVGSAADNAAYWSIATTMRSDNKALSAVQDALGLGAAKTDVAYTAMESSKDVVDEIKKKLVAASEPGVDKSKIQKEVKELQNQLVSIAKSASFSGENWVYTDANNAAGTKSVVGSFNRDAKGNVSLTTLQFDTNKSSLIEVDTAGNNVTNGTGLLSSNISYTDTSGGGTGSTVSLSFSVLSLDITNMTTGALSQALSGVDSILTQMTDAAADLGALNSRVELQKGFVDNLSDSIEKGVGRLVDADMNEESTRLKALQTQQQLGIQALSIANSNSQNVLSLFR